MNYFPNGISVIICCFNSATRLPKTLEHIALQEVPPNINWEVIMVDNNSNDLTSEVAKTEWNTHKKAIPFKIVKEETPGLSHARNKGAKEAAFELLLFCDDDNWLEKNYVRYAYEIMNTNEKIGVLGGRSEGFYETEKPLWFDHFGQAYAIGKPHGISGIINARTFIAGAGMIVRKSTLQLLETLSFKQLLSDRKGNKLSSGGDSELCLILLFLGYDLYYDERLQFIHFMTANRLSWKYCVLLMAEGQAIPQVYFEFYNYCYKKIMNNEMAEFKNAFIVMRKKLLRRILRTFISMKPFWYSFKLLMKSQPGSTKEIKLKANINKFKYLLTHKKNLRKDFNIICELMQHIQQYKNAISSQYAPLKNV
ncbi:MAG TPA: glycosyltransferase [Chitinophagaceae bacterium]|nr:glycosyltransferase [Chitinophagaceae bacterium]